MKVERDTNGTVVKVPEGYLICPECNGTGGYRPAQIECPSCKTQGYIAQPAPQPEPNVTMRKSGIRVRHPGFNITNPD